MRPTEGAPNPQDIAAAAKWPAEARSPPAIALRGPGDEAAFAAFARRAEVWAIPVRS